MDNFDNSVYQVFVFNNIIAVKIKVISIFKKWKENINISKESTGNFQLICSKEAQLLLWRGYLVQTIVDSIFTKNYNIYHQDVFSRSNMCRF